MRILITRPVEDAEALAAKLGAAGHEVVSEPLLEIRPIADATVDLDRVQAILFTSANGVRAFAAIERRRDLPVFAVGDATAATARAVGFEQVESAAGRVADLVTLVRERLKPENGTLLHAAGRDLAGNLAGTLAAAGFEVRQSALYSAEAVTAFSPSTVAALRDGRVDLVIFYSPRTAETFRQLVERAGLVPMLAKIRALAISPAAVGPVMNLGWATLDAAQRPDESELLKLVEQTAAAAVPRPDDAELMKLVGQMAAARAPRAAAGVPPPIPPPPADTLREKESAARRGAPQAPLRQRLMAPMVGLAVLLSIGTFALLLLEQNRPMPDAAGPAALRLDGRLAVLERQIAVLSRDSGRAAIPELEGRLKQLEQSIATVVARPAVSAGASPDEVARLAELERRTAAIAVPDDVMRRLSAVEAALEKRPDAGDLAAMMAENRRLAADLARVQEQLPGLEGARTQNASRDAILLAAGQLALAAAHGDPVAIQVSTLRNLAGDEPRLAAALTAIPAAADRSVPTADALAARFHDLAARAVHAASDFAAPAAGSLLADWWQGVVRRLSQAVTVRRVGDVSGDAAEARIARAEQALAVRDLAGAVAALDGMGGPAAGVLVGWLGDARARLALDRAVNEVTAAAIAGAAPSR